MYVSCQTEVGRVNDFISAGIIQNCLGMNSCLVCECAEACDRVVEGDIDFYRIGDQVFDMS